MNVNADFSKRAVAHAASTPWVQSPMPGVERRMLDRIGGEVARATSIVRYAPGSAFSAHTHTGGEEYLVLEGVFQDEHGDFPVGSYVRNPPTSSHTPSAAQGAVILVKLWQFDPEDRTAVHVDTLNAEPVAVEGHPGVRQIALFKDRREHVRIELWPANQQIGITGHKGLEILVIDGSFEEGGEKFTAQSWLRLPAGQDFAGRTGPEGARLWIKSDHLAEPQTAPNA